MIGAAMTIPNPHGGDVRALMHFEAGKKSIGAAYLLYLFLGGVGGHRFYCGFPVSAVLMIVLTVASIAAGGAPLILLVIWLLADAFAIPSWIRGHNTKLANMLMPPASVREHDRPPPIPDPDAKARIQQAENRNTAATQSGRRNALYFGFAAVVFWIVVASAAAIKRSSQEKPTPQTAAGEMSPEFAAKVAEYTTPPAPAPPSANATATVETAQTNTWGAVVQSSSPQPLAQVDVKPSAKQPDPMPEILVPSDMKARYYAESISSTKSGRARIVSKRIGPSGTSYTHRECDCGQSTYRTIGDGESLEAMRAATAEQKMAKLVHDGTGFGSVSFHVCDHACKSNGSEVNRKAAAKSGADVKATSESAKPKSAVKKGSSVGATHTSSMSFPACLELIRQTAAAVGEVPTNIVETASMRVVRISAADGSVLVTCNGSNETLTMVESSNRCGIDVNC